MLFTGCASNDVKESASLAVPTMPSDLVAYLSEISKQSGGEISQSNFRSESSDLKLVNWCGTQDDVNQLKQSVVKACVINDGVTTGNWCYDPRIAKPHFLFEVRESSKAQALCGSSKEWVASLSTPSNHYTSVFWLSSARKMGFLTPEQVALKSKLTGSLALKKSEDEFAEYLESTRRDLQKKYSNKAAIQGSYGHKVCKWDDDFYTLEGVTIGRVLSTYDNQFQLELVDYQSLSGTYDGFPKGQIVFGKYEDWSLCNG